MRLLAWAFSCASLLSAALGQQDFSAMATCKGLDGDGSGRVNVQDLLLILANFGAECGLDQSLLTTGMQGHVKLYMFDGDGNDMTGRGTVTGATLTTDRNGVTQNAYSFDGAGDLIVVTTPFGGADEEFSMALWV